MALTFEQAKKLKRGAKIKLIDFSYSIHDISCKNIILEVIQIKVENNEQVSIKFNHPKTGISSRYHFRFDLVNKEGYNYKGLMTGGNA